MKHFLANLITSMLNDFERILDEANESYLARLEAEDEDEARRNGWLG